MARGKSRSNTMRHKRGGKAPKTGRSKHDRLQGLGRIRPAGAPAFKGGRGGAVQNRHF